MESNPIRFLKNVAMLTGVFFICFHGSLGANVKADSSIDWSLVLDASGGVGGSSYKIEIASTGAVKVNRLIGRGVPEVGCAMLSEQELSRLSVNLELLSGKLDGIPRSWVGMVADRVDGWLDVQWPGVGRQERFRLSLEPPPRDPPPGYLMEIAQLAWKFRNLDAPCTVP